MFKDFFNFGTNEKDTRAIDELERLKKEEAEKRRQEEAEQNQEPKEYIDVSVTGSYKFTIEDSELLYSWGANPYYVKFTYKAKAKFLNEVVDCAGIFRIEEEIGNTRVIGGSKDRAYGFLLKLVDEGQERIMDELKKGIAGNIYKYAEEKNIKSLSKKVKENTDVGFNFTFKVEQDSRVKNLKKYTK